MGVLFSARHLRPRRGRNSQEAECEDGEYAQEVHTGHGHDPLFQNCCQSERLSRLRLQRVRPAAMLKSEKSYNVKKGKAKGKRSKEVQALKR